MNNWKTTTIVKKIPEVNCNGTSDGDESKETDVFGGYDEGERNACCNEPSPPGWREWLMSISIEEDVHPD